MFRNYGILVGQVLVTKPDFYHDETRHQVLQHGAMRKVLTRKVLTRKVLTRKVPSLEIDLRVILTAPSWDKA